MQHAVKRRPSTLAGLGIVLAAALAACQDGDEVCGPACDKASGQGGGGGEPCALDDARLKFEQVKSAETETSTDFAFLPGGEGKILIALRAGGLRLAQIHGETLDVLGSFELPDPIESTGACVLANVLPDPEFSQNGFVYTTYCRTMTNTRLVRYRFSEESGLSDSSLIFETILDEEVDYWHRFGSLGFEADGKTLWMLVGDHQVPENGQDLVTPLGSMIRILPNRKAGEGGYSIPAGNLAELREGASAPPEEVHPAVFAYGLRSPWRGTRDARGRWFIGDVARAGYEEVNLLARAGQNFGWSNSEGPCEADCAGQTDPIAYYGRSADDPYALDDPDTEPVTKRVVWVGDIKPDGGADPYCGRLDDVVFFGDFYAGWVRGLRVSGKGKVTQDALFGHLPKIVAWRFGADGYAYALTLSGRLYRASLEAR